MNGADMMMLPADLGSGASSALLESFLAHQGSDLTVYCADVQRFGAQCLQVLLAASASWAADGNKLLFKNFSTELLDTLEVLGVTPAQLACRKDMPA